MASVELDGFGGTSLQATCVMTAAAVESRFGQAHLTDIGGKVSKWWGFRCGPWRWSVYERIGDDELHIGGNSMNAVWFALTALCVPQPIAWRPSGVPHEWCNALLDCPTGERIVWDKAE